jgi:hypothetical protein
MAHIDETLDKSGISLQNLEVTGSTYLKHNEPAFTPISSK